MPINSFENYPLSWKPEKDKLKKPYYKSLSSDLERKIKSGELKEGMRLPPQREIADYLDINYTTITRVYNDLKQKGLIYGTVGKGTFVSPHASEDVTIKATEEEIIELASVNGFSECTALVEKATKAVVEKGYLKNLYEYSYPLGQIHQRLAALSWLKMLAVDAKEENIAILSGAQNAIAVALISLFSAGDKIALDVYSYPNFIELSKMLKISLVPIEGDSFGMLPSALEKALKSENIKGIYLMPTSSNPTNITIPLERRMELSEVIKDHDLLLIEDDISSWLKAIDEPISPSFYNLLNGNSIYITGMTKSLAAGLRIAYMAFPKHLKSKIEHGILNVNIKTSSLDAEIITELLLTKDAIKIAREKKERLCRAERIYNKYFHQDNSLSYYRWLKINTKKGASEIEEDLKERGIRIYHSKRFQTRKDDASSYLRISLCSAGSDAKLEKGLRILKEYLEEIRAL